MRVALVSMILALGACNKELPPELASALNDDPATTPEGKKLAPVTKEEAEAFGKNIAKLLDTCVASEIALLWRVDITVARALKDSTIDATTKSGVKSALTSERLWDGQCQSLRQRRWHQHPHRHARGRWHPAPHRAHAELGRPQLR